MIWSGFRLSWVVMCPRQSLPSPPPPNRLCTRTHTCPFSFAFPALFFLPPPSSPTRLCVHASMSSPSPPRTSNVFTRTRTHTVAFPMSMSCTSIPSPLSTLALIHLCLPNLTLLRARTDSNAHHPRPRCDREGQTSCRLSGHGVPFHPRLCDRVSLWHGRLLPLCRSRPPTLVSLCPKFLYSVTIPPNGSLERFTSSHIGHHCSSRMSIVHQTFLVDICTRI